MTPTTLTLRDIDIQNFVLTSSHRSAHAYSKSSSDNISPQSRKRSFVDLTGDDKEDNDTVHDSVLDGLESRDRKNDNINQNALNRRDHTSVDHVKSRLLSIFNTDTSLHESNSSAQPRRKRVKAVDDRRLSSSDNESQRSVV